MPDWITGREAAEILGVHESHIWKMRRRGDLTPRPDGRRPSLDRAQVVELAGRRAEAKRLRELPPPSPQPPDDEHEWLLIKPAAVILGTTPGSLSNRVSRGQVPCTKNDHRRWFRLDHLEMLLRARHAEAVSSCWTTLISAPR